MKLYIVNGPNLNMLGIREPDIYGRHTYEDLVNELTAYCAEKGVEPIFVQSNHEGELVTAIQNAYFEEADGIVINPAAYTHTSVALLDALKAIALPAVEVHLSDVSAREDFRQISYVREACIATISGKGFDGYKEAIDLLLQK
ncbi:MAG: type II 3-dehydroquinate dehydratase [Clostridia bacterium]|nr:type II 3-dehydroquinate dehydratase [Clostridia bacterium]